MCWLAQILDYFLISGVKQTSQKIHISLYEKKNPKLSSNMHFESKGFMEAINVTDFPIRDHKVILKIRRRYCTDLRTGKSFNIPIDLDVVAKGTRYSNGDTHRKLHIRSLYLLFKSSDK